MATAMTGSGKVIVSRMTGCPGSHSVSPVKVLLQTNRRRDVAGAHLLDFFAVVGVHLQQTRPMRSRSPLVEL